MNYEELNILVKYCSNRVNADKFVELMLPRYNDENYIMNLWPQFRDNACMFIIARSETELFESIQKEIRDTNYKG
jgi:hypothetical protein